MCKGVKFRIVSDNFKASSGIDLPGDVAFRGGCLAGGAGNDERFASGNDEMVVTGNDDEGGWERTKPDFTAGLRCVVRPAWACSNG